MASNKFDNALLKVLEKEAEKEKAQKKKKRKSLELRKEKSLNYYSGWGR